ncbi:glycosyltransferase [Cryobacterium zongtaii]|uniref:glycosyltransferase n=1 Tax=Cryobacterium zongtaii TaxID=1259217 RepID=UPI0013FD9339|nr:glycosyltransferase [Cryobacterium zongtaii]
MNSTESPVNAALISEITGGQKAVSLLYGLDASDLKGVGPEGGSSTDTKRLKVLGIGNDRHRDWGFFLRVAEGLSAEFDVRIATRSLDQNLALPANCAVVQARSGEELAELYSWADIVCLPLRANFHASGVTVAMEAAAAGKPVLATRTGGIDAYFPSLSGHMLSAPNSEIDWIERLGKYRLSQEERLRVARALQNDVEANELTLDGYARRLLALSQEIRA